MFVFFFFKRKMETSNSSQERHLRPQSNWFVLVFLFICFEAYKVQLLNLNLGCYSRDQSYFEGAVNILENLDSIDFILLMSGMKYI